MAKLHKLVRELSHGYYLAQVPFLLSFLSLLSFFPSFRSFSFLLCKARRVKKWEKALSRSTHQALLVRYSFKVLHTHIYTSIPHIYLVSLGLL